MQRDLDDDDEAPASEQDLLVVLRLSNRLMGTNQERMDLDAFADELDVEVTNAGVGEYDGNELGAGECTLFFCGSNLDALQSVLRPLLKRSPLCRGAHFVRMVTGADGKPNLQRTPL